MKRRRRKVRIYLTEPGPGALYYTVPVRDATTSVTINGSVFHALSGYSGQTVGCAMSNVACDNAKAFPHPVYLAAVTKSTMTIVDKWKNGKPAGAVRYGHSYGYITEWNDKGTLRKMVRDDPSIMERPFNLRPPRKHSGPASGRSSSAKKNDGSRLVVHRGAAARAAKAGLIRKDVLSSIKERAAA